MALALAMALVEARAVALAVAMALALAVSAGLPGGAAVAPCAVAVAAVPVAAAVAFMALQAATLTMAALAAVVSGPAHGRDLDHILGPAPDHIPDLGPALDHIPYRPYQGLITPSMVVAGGRIMVLVMSRIMALIGAV